MNNDISQMVQQCAVCAEHLPSQKGTMRNLPISMYLMQLVGVNLTHFQNDQYLIMGDRYSGYVWIAKMSPVTPKSVTDQLFLWFLEYGSPDAIRSDGGPLFRKTLKLFCKDHQIEHELASSYNPKSNGHAEAAVKSVKFLLEKTAKSNKNFDVAPSAFRQMPCADGYSPAEMLFKCKLHGLLAQIRHSPSHNSEHATIARENTWAKNREKSTASDEIPSFAAADKVLIQNHASK